MKFYLTFFVTGLMMILFQRCVQPQEKTEISFQWSELPSIPDSFGFAGSFAGVSHNALIVAGGANFPDGGVPWTGSKKVWSDKVFVLEEGSSNWHTADMLPQPLGYGVSISWNNRLICVGGSNEEGHSGKVMAISYHDGRMNVESLPDLPRPLANSCGALVGNTIYIAGGLFTPDANEAAAVFWSLELSDNMKNAAWKQLDTWPGAARMLSVAGAGDQAFYLFSGTGLSDRNGKITRQYLTDAYKYTVGKGWSEIASLPTPVVAAPTPAYVRNDMHFIFGGDDGRLADSAAKLENEHPGFSTDILCYDTRQNLWWTAGKIPVEKKADAAENPNGSQWAPVTTPMVEWNETLVFPGGEVRPAVRTPNIKLATPVNNDQNRSNEKD